MRHILLFATVILFISCGEKLIEQPENLIARDKMVLIVKDMTIIHAAKSTNIGKLKDNGIDPTAYVFHKYKVDSAQFVASDRYYASVPLAYESIYKEVESLLDQEKEVLKDLKKINDSLKQLQRQEKNLGKKRKGGVPTPTNTKHIPQ